MANSAKRSVPSKAERDPNWRSQDRPETSQQGRDMAPAAAPPAPPGLDAPQQVVHHNAWRQVSMMSPLDQHLRIGGSSLMSGWNQQWQTLPQTARDVAPAAAPFGHAAPLVADSDANVRRQLGFLQASAPQWAAVDCGEQLCALSAQVELLQRKVDRTKNHIAQLDVEMRHIEKQLKEQQDEPKARRHQKKAKAKSKAPPSVPQELWDRAHDEAPKVAGNIQWQLQELNAFGNVHDPRVKKNLNSRLVAAVAGLLVRRVREGTDKAHEDHWRYGILVREHETPGMWYVKFDDSEVEEAINCGKEDLYGVVPLPPVKVGQLEVTIGDSFSSSSSSSLLYGKEVVCCINPISGEYYKNEKGEVIQLELEDLQMSEARQQFESVCGHPNGLRLMLPAPNGRILDPMEDHRTLQEAMLFTQEDMMSEQNQKTLELYHVAKDGTRRLIWHSNTPATKRVA